MSHGRPKQIRIKCHQMNEFIHEVVKTLQITYSAELKDDIKNSENVSLETNMTKSFIFI